MGVRRFDNYGEVLFIDPSVFPVDAGLVGSEPWVTKDYLVVAQVGQEESHVRVVVASSHSEVGVVSQVTHTILGTIDVEDRSGVCHCLDGESQPFHVV